MKTANLTIVPSLFFINGITASLMAPKGIKHYSFASICFSKTKIPTTVTSATSQFQGLGVLWYNSFNALSGITLPNELRSKFSLRYDVNIFFSHTHTKIQKKSTIEEHNHMEYFNHITSGIFPYLSAPNFKPT